MEEAEESSKGHLQAGSPGDLAARSAGPVGGTRRPPSRWPPAQPENPKPTAFQNGKAAQSVAVTSTVEGGQGPQTAGAARARPSFLPLTPAPKPIGRCPPTGGRIPTQPLHSRAH